METDFLQQFGFRYRPMGQDFGRPKG